VTTCKKASATPYQRKASSRSISAICERMNPAAAGMAGA
jgi:hypothetical protein